MDPDATLGQGLQQGGAWRQKRTRVDGVITFGAVDPGQVVLLQDRCAPIGKQVGEIRFVRTVDIPAQQGIYGGFVLVTLFPQANIVDLDSQAQVTKPGPFDFGGVRIPGQLPIAVAILPQMNVQAFDVLEQRQGMFFISIIPLK